MLIIQIGFIALTLLCLLLIFLGFRFAARRAFGDTGKKQAFLLKLFLVLAGWTAAASALSFTPFLKDFSSTPPRFPVLIIPPAVLLILLARNQSFLKVLSEIPHQWILWFQAFRIPVEFLLWGMFLVQVFPEHLTFEGRNFDIFAGIFGLLVGWFVHKKEAHKPLLIAYNVLGLILLANIVGAAILTFPTPFQVFTEGYSNTIVTQFPVVWLPALLVPMAYYGHVFSLLKLKTPK
jgi:hypothetical protein